MWAAIVFWLMILPLLILMMIVYAKTRKLYRITYILSVFTYSMAIMYAIDAYSLGKNWILSLLGLSAVLMMYLGYHFHTLKKPKSKTAKKKKSKKSKKRRK